MPFPAVQRGVYEMRSVALSKPGLIFFALLAVVIGFYNNLGGVPLFDVDEGAFSEATNEMLRRHDYVSPTLFGEPRYDKPILIYWLQAASVSLFGLNEAALRLPSAVAATLWALAIYLFLKRLGRPREGALAACIMAASLAVPIIARVATADAVLNLFITCSMLCIYLFYHERHKGYVYMTFVFAALGFLDKGPIAVLIPFVVSALFFSLRSELGRWLRAAFNPVGVALFMVIALPWYILEFNAAHGGFIESFFGQHNIGRFTGVMEGHSGSVFYYVPMVLLALVPYTSVFIKLLAKIGALLKRDLELYMLLWFLFVFVFFSVSDTKLPHYILYGFTGVFILLGLHFWKVRTQWLAFLPAMMFFAAMLLLPEIISLAVPHIRDDFARTMLEGHARYFSLAYRSFFLFALLLAGWFVFEKRLSQTVKLVVCGLLVSFGISQFLEPAVAGIQQQPVKEAALIANTLEHNVVMWGLNRPSFGVYSVRPVVRRAPRPGDVVVTRTTNLGYLRDYDLLYSKNGIALLRFFGQSRAAR